MRQGCCYRRSLIVGHDMGQRKDPTSFQITTVKYMLLPSGGMLFVFVFLLVSWWYLIRNRVIFFYVRWSEFNRSCHNHSMEHVVVGIVVYRYYIILPFHLVKILLFRGAAAYPLNNRVDLHYGICFDTKLAYQISDTEAMESFASSFKDKDHEPNSVLSCRRSQQDSCVQSTWQVQYWYCPGRHKTVKDVPLIHARRLRLFVTGGKWIGNDVSGTNTLYR